MNGIVFLLTLVAFILTCHKEIEQKICHMGVLLKIQYNEVEIINVNGYLRHTTCHFS